jgi:hypothetical protein
MALEPVDLAISFIPECERECGRKATVIAQGCMDKQPALLCDECFKRGIEVIETYIKMHMRLNKRVIICGDCHRPLLSLDTHLNVKRLE